MPKGKAQGIDRVYQELCLDIVRELQSDYKLVPYERDGIDITFPLCETEVTFDAVLKDNKGNLVVIESKRYKSKAIEQRDVFAFWSQIEWLQRSLRVAVNGIMVTGSNYRIGAIKAAGHLGISVAVCEPGQTLDRFCCFISQI
ncbi:MAG: hypothetical protein U0401_25250 [Anaerolineae bacterium]